MENKRDPLAGYCSQLVSGLVASAVVATTLHAEVASLTLLAVVALVVVAISYRMLRDRTL